jgi:hypothetical protein
MKQKRNIWYPLNIGQSYGGSDYKEIGFLEVEHGQVFV